MDKELAREQFIEENLRLVHSLCRRFAGRGIEYDDLFGAGSIGLVKAADAFDSERGLQFSTYAVPVILGEIRRLFRDGGAVKVSRSVKELSLKINRERESLELKLGREASVGEIAQSLGVSPEEVAEAVCAMQPVVSLTYESDGEISELPLPTENPEEWLCDRICLSVAFKKLDDNEKRLIKLRYFDCLTQSKTAEQLSMTQVQVSRSEKKILKKLRSIIELGA